MAQARVVVEVDIERLRRVAEAFQWFAGRLSAAADELHDALDGHSGTVHASPVEGIGLTPCCGRTPFELPRTDRMTVEPGNVTCVPVQSPEVPT